MIYGKKYIVMQRLIDHLNNGYSFWVSGRVEIEKCEKFVKKMELLYGVSLDRNERARRKRHQIGNAKLELYTNGIEIVWWLLVTNPEKGFHPAHSHEKLKNALGHEGRIEFDGCELVRTTKNGQSRPVFTWRMQEEKYSGFREQIIESIRNEPTYRLEQLLSEIWWSQPGFHGIRSQIGKMASLYRAELRRCGRKNAPHPPKKLAYIRRVKHDGVHLHTLLRNKNKKNEK